MTSFLQKLRKGMGVKVSDGLEKEKLEEKPEDIFKRKKVGKIKIKEKLDRAEIKNMEEEKDLKAKDEGEIEIEKGKWFEAEGQLAVDLYQNEKELVIQSAIAGVKPENLDISIEGDVVTIRGERKNPDSDKEKRYFYQECYWGPFSREIILPEETDPSRAQATMKEGVLTIRIPKIERKKKKKIEVKDFKTIEE